MSALNSFGGAILIAVIILFMCHLSVDRDFPDTVKNVAMGASVVFCVLYVIFVVF